MFVVACVLQEGIQENAETIQIYSEVQWVISTGYLVTTSVTKVLQEVTKVLQYKFYIGASRLFHVTKHYENGA